MDLLPFAKEVLRLKDLKRTGWRLEDIDGESVADHCFSLALLAYTYSRKFNINTEKCIKMALIHDLCEIYSGDIPRRNENGEWQHDSLGKRDAEESGFQKVVGLLPQELRQEFRDLWEEFKARETPEARLVKDLDRLEMCLQALRYSGQGRGKDLSHFFEDGNRDIKTPEIRKVFEILFRDYRNKMGNIKKAD